MTHLQRQANTLMQSLCGNVDRLSRMHAAFAPAIGAGKPAGTLRAEEALMYARVLCKAVEKFCATRRAAEYEQLASAMKSLAQQGKALSARETADWEQVYELAEKCLVILECRDQVQQAAASRQVPPGQQG